MIGEKWAFLILRGALNGLQHFEEFQAGLGIARNILSDRLGKMVAGGILERSPDPDDRRRVIYSLSAKGEGLLPVVLALRQWGEQWGYGEMRVELADRRDGKPVRKICVQAHDGRELTLHDLTWIERRTASGRGQQPNNHSMPEHVVAQRARVVQRIVRHLAVRRRAEAGQLDELERQRRDFDHRPRAGHAAAC